MTFGSANDPLAGKFAKFTVNDTDGDNRWDRDNNPSTQETATLVEGNDTELVLLDSAMGYDATLTYADGTTANISAVLAQLADGRFYLLPEFQNNSDVAAMEAGPIRSLRLNRSLTNDAQIVADRVATNFVPCFEAETRIAVPGGRARAGNLVAGDLLVTPDGPVPILWVGRSRVPASGGNAPVRFAPGAIGNARVLRVSPEHRMLVTGWRAELLYGEAAVLVPAKSLLGMAGVTREEGGWIDYVHILTKRHSILDAEGAAAESFFPGAEAMARLSPVDRLRILAALPDGIAAYGAAAPIIRSRSALPLAA
ncbi:Hint domain-containing protein [Hasllibacter halocynthiae]|uniref:Hint domain-containing protein n=1 Tax=Hasllibacter halocynthiae TaxID=595589 RepID=UPI001304C758|nr:Hint domain-containing protein [Hasllibacter halocynthiae]